MYWLEQFTARQAGGISVNGLQIMYDKSKPERYLILLDNMRIEGDCRSVSIIGPNYIVHKVYSGIYSVTVDHAGLWYDLDERHTGTMLTFANQWSVEPTWKLKLMDKNLANCDYKFIYSTDGSLAAIDIYHGQVSYRLVIGPVYKLWTGCQLIGEM